MIIKVYYYTNLIFQKSAHYPFYRGTKFRWFSREEYSLRKKADREIEGVILSKQGHTVIDG